MPERPHVSHVWSFEANELGDGISREVQLGLLDQSHLERLISYEWGI
jgi:hypothetical protein